MLVAGVVALLLALGVAATLWRLRAVEAPLRPLPSSPPLRFAIWFMAQRADGRFPLQHPFLRWTPFAPAGATKRSDFFAKWTMLAGPTARWGLALGPESFAVPAGLSWAGAA